ncbi:aldehyde dehydrogenase, partial [Enterobacter hormaechei]|nr:aldehyde dehydrogenase [Enterobacter hormaechei]
VTSKAQVGNIYVNRNMVGAVVGVQPFGGEGLSGTGPKAGGPLYLYRLLSQRPLNAANQTLARQDAEYELDARSRVALHSPLYTLADWAVAQNHEALGQVIQEYSLLA